MSVKYIAITGKKRHGKDTFATILALRLNKYSVENAWIFLQRGGTMEGGAGMYIRIKRFAQPFINTTCHYLGFSPAEWERVKDVQLPYKNFTPRDFLKTFAKAVQTLTPDIAVDVLLRETGEQEGIVIIPDLRLQREWSGLPAANTRYVKVIRPSLESIDTHFTECELDDVPDNAYTGGVYINDGWLDSFDRFKKLWDSLEKFD